MSSSLSPDQFGSAQSHSSPDGTATSQDCSPLNLGFLKSLTEKRTTRDGNPAKRRGPKPDSKPALTRRQELNRQAQRTHRERKELYIKALEDEVLRLKELYSNASQSKEKLLAENKYLKTIMAQHGVRFPRSADRDNGGSPGASGASPGNSGAPGSYASFSPGSQSGTSTGHSTNFQLMAGQQMRSAVQQLANKGVDFEQAGIDFVLTYDNPASSRAYPSPPPQLEKPCMQHLPFLTSRSEGGDPCGHALMASCPPAPFGKLTTKTPFGNTHTHDRGDGSNPAQGTWEISKADLSTLLDLSQRLDLDGEITPVMAWGMILSHPRFADFQPEDFAKIAAELGRKVRCYGFGAVMEEFELRDAFESVLPSGMEPEIMAH
ncbi:bZIP-type transcription factor [Metarhizium album ARSEF 1941]|uniref:BZIP-type transcription factor n=1 Tax=Metarhizium album (strain ARSEF 1941) TaxID=1081103 RepID=A0A0B2WYN4_METAS|nr:bZIP-type transcription factor [Metarhizium album ARSEF 1941]KHN98537.1 bZIP-type transcription factor [Metarhizium album ARSEF 1941]